jgi:F-type H+-transporting ATPase subunit epsilon
MVETASGKSLKCVVVTPERAVLDEAADFVALPMYDGELGVLPGRAALIGRLGFGELRLKQGGRTQRYYVDGGFAQVRADVVTVLTPRALNAEEINAGGGRLTLSSAKALCRSAWGQPEARDAARQA